MTVIEFPDMVPGGPTGVDAPEAVALSAGVVRCSNYTAHLGAHFLKHLTLFFNTVAYLNAVVMRFAYRPVEERVARLEGRVFWDQAGVPVYVVRIRVMPMLPNAEGWVRACMAAIGLALHHA